MKVRDSGMPEAALWETFFDPDATLDVLAFPGAAADVVEFGCGYGLFSVAAGLRTTGTVHAVDIDRGMIEATATRAGDQDLGNVKPVLRDFVAQGTGLPNASVDYAMLFNILHGENPARLVPMRRRWARPCAAAVSR